MKRKEVIAQYEIIQQRLDTSLHYRNRAFEHALKGETSNPRPLTGQAQGERDILNLAVRKASREVTLAKLGLRKGNEEGVERLYLQFIVEMEEGLAKNPLMGEDYHTGQVEFLKRLRLAQEEKISHMS